MGSVSSVFFIKNTEEGSNINAKVIYPGKIKAWLKATKNLNPFIAT